MGIDNAERDQTVTSTKVGKYIIVHLLPMIYIQIAYYRKDSGGQRGEAGGTKRGRKDKDRKTNKGELGKREREDILRQKGGKLES